MSRSSPLSTPSSQTCSWAPVLVLVLGTGCVTASADGNGALSPALLQARGVAQAPAPPTPASASAAAPALLQARAAAQAPAPPAPAAASSGPPVAVTTVEGIHEYRLANGLRVLLFPDASKPTVTVNLTVFVGSRHEGYGETGHGPPARAHALQGDAHPRQHLEAAPGPGGPVQRHHLVRPDQLLRGAACLAREPGVRHLSRGRPHGEQHHRRRRAGQGVLGRAQRVRDGGEQPRRRARGEDVRRRLPVAQLRQEHHRLARRHRAGAGRQPAGLLPTFLPAGQRPAGGGRQVRPGQGPRAHRAHLRGHPPADAQAARHLDRGAGAGRRALGAAAADGGRRRGGRPLPRGGRRRPGLERVQRHRRHPHQQAGRPPVQGAGGEGAGQRGVRPRVPHGRAGRPVPGGQGPPGRLAREGARRPDQGCRGPGPVADHRGRGRPLAGPLGQGVRAGADRHLPGRGGAVGLGGHGRLAAVLPHPRPAQAGQGGRRHPGGQGLPAAGQPDAGDVPADEGPRAAGHAVPGRRGRDR